MQLITFYWLHKIINPSRILWLRSIQNWECTIHFKDCVSTDYEFPPSYFPTLRNYAIKYLLLENNESNLQSTHAEQSIPFPFFIPLLCLRLLWLLHSKLNGLNIVTMWSPIVHYSDEQCAVPALPCTYTLEHHSHNSNNSFFKPGFIIAAGNVLKAYMYMFFMQKYNSYT